MTDDATYRAMKQRALTAEAECERLRADAERYKHLRDIDPASTDQDSLCVCNGYGDGFIGDELDAAIDAARAKP